MSLQNYQPTGYFNETANLISDNDAIPRRGTAGFSETAGNETSGTGAVKKTKNVPKKNNKDRGPKKENFNKSKFQNPTKRQSGSQTVSHVESMSYNNYNPHNRNTYQRNTYQECSYDSFDNMNSNSARNSRHFHEESSYDLTSDRNVNYKNSSARYSRYENISRCNEENSRENSPKPNKNSKFRNGNNSNFQNYHENVHQDYSDIRKFNRNARYKNDRDRNYRYVNEETSQDKKIDGRNGEYFQRKQMNYGRNYNNKKKFQKKVEIASQRERLEEMLKHRTLECLVCCELLKHHNQVWSCKQCYHILHLKCTQAWAKSSKLENGWRCPACQNVCKEIPAEYLCFCGKQKHPRNEPGLIAHSCGEICLRQRRNCEHNCLILCHPGPCPDCTILVDKSCGCGKSKQQVMCSSEVEIICDSLCEKFLECGVHKCYEKCHMGDCKPCEKILHQTCFCEKANRDVTCCFEYQGSTYYSCGDVCGKKLKCKNHECQDICHGGECKPCKRDCSLIKNCYCGKKPLEVPRISCLDPIPSCGLLCQKTLKCGPNGNRHKCESTCHDGDCPPCNLSTILKCRCGSMNREIPCQKLVDDARCERKCAKKRLCGKHKCNQRCCIEIDHICPLPCNRTLSCGNHRCELTCHNGRCKPCMETSFEELYCECGSEVMYPPIPCGTRPPVCDKPCSRPRECGHEVNHACHTGPCPPCTILCKRWCYGKHELRGAIPCHQEEFSCGLPCGKPMPCGRHKCSSPCHSGACPVPCKQPCMFERAVCGHPCNAPCHELPCPQTSCKSKVAVSCICGIQKGVRSCNDVTNEMRNIEMARLSEKMMSMSKNESVDISDMSKPERRPSVLKILECTEECRVMERNRRLAIGLQIRNPDISQKLTPRYSDFMKRWATKDPHFCRRIHDKLTELVVLAKQSQQKCRSHSFESMNRDKRQFIHEYCEHFGCESEAYDTEPNRNVVATAIRDKSWLPSMSLLEVIQRENGQRKVPMPSHLERNLCSKSESVALKPLGRTVRLGVSQTDTDNLKSSI